MCANNNVLVVDAGNTSVKWSLFNADGEVLEHLRSATPPGFEGVSSIFYASVKGDQIDGQLCAEIQHHFPGALFVKLASTQVPDVMKNGYLHPERLGVDRWLGIVACHFRYPGNTMLIDAGTALKIDFVTENGVYLGGYISPGLAMMRQSLVAGTGRIRFEDHEMGLCRGVPDTTALAVQYGVSEMLLGMVERQCRQYPECQIVMTGGDAPWLKGSLRLDAIYDESLVAKGGWYLGRYMTRGGA